MTPHPIVHFKVALAIARIVRIVPEIDRHRRHRRGDHHFTYLLPYGTSVFIIDFQSAAQRATLDFARIHGEHGASSHEGAADVSTAAHRRQPQVLLHLMVHPFETFWWKRASRRTQRPQRRKNKVITGSDTSHPAHQNRTGTRPKVVVPEVLCKVPKH